MTQPPIIEVQLVHIEGPLKGKIQEITESPIVLGRIPSCQVCFPADVTLVSRTHAQIIREGNRFRLVDCSTNGTLLNGNRVEQAYLKNGDVITLAPGGPKISFLTRVIDDRLDSLGLKPHDMPGRHARSEYVTGLEKPSKPAHAGHAELFPPPKPYGVPGDDLLGLSVQVPLVIQYGPTLRNFTTLPVTLGSNPACDFVLLHSSIADRHAEFFFAKGQYWIKDLTGEGQISVNEKVVGSQAPLGLNDTLRLAPEGPVFCFLGDGRLAEVEGGARHSGYFKGGQKRPGTAKAKRRTIFWLLTVPSACLVLALLGFILYHASVKRDEPYPWVSAGKKLESVWTETKDRFGSLVNTLKDGSKGDRPLVGEAVLKVQSRPVGAEVYVDGTLHGKAPMNLRLTLGKHEVRLTYTGHYDWEAQIELKEEGETPIFARLVPLDGN